MGRITESFRMRFQKEINSLKRTYKEALMDAGRRDAFDSLIRAWSGEQGAMSYARVPDTLSVMLLTAATDNRKQIEEIEESLRVLKSKLEEISANVEIL